MERESEPALGVTGTERNLENPDFVQEIRCAMAENVEKFISNAMRDRKKEWAEKLRTNEKIGWSVILDECLLGVLVKEYRILDPEFINKARSLIFKQDIDTIKEKIKKEYGT